MTTSLFRSPVFWGGLAAVAVGTGAYLHTKRGRLLGRSNPTPVLVKKNPAKMPPVTETRTENGVTMRRYELASMSIDERLKLIQARVWDGVNDPRIRKLALQITRSCGRDDGACEAQRVFDYVKANVRYTGDIGPVLNPKTGKVEAIDLYQKPWVTLEYGGGDCDDHVGVIASLLTVIGHTVRLRVSASSRFGDWEHIYPVTLLPKHAPKLARAVDTTLPWNAKLGSEARYGKARDYTVEAPA